MDISGFDFALNPDVFSGQQPQTDDEKAEMQKDEKSVREACAYLVDKVIPDLVCFPFAPLCLQYQYLRCTRLRILRKGMLGPQWMGIPFLV